MYRHRGLSAGKVTAVLLVVGVLFGVLLLKGFELAKRRRIEARIESLSKTRDGLLQELANQRRRVDELTQQLNNQNAELGEFKATVQGYMLDHKMAVAAILFGAGGASVAIDKDNVFTQDTKNAGAIMTTAATAWAVFNSDEMSDVIKTLNQANAAVHTKDTTIAGIASAIQQQKIAAETTQSRLEENTHQMAELQNELDR